MAKGDMIIRTDAGARIGAGHLMRCIALAQAWQNQGGNVTFLSKCDVKGLQQLIIAEGFKFVPIEMPHPDARDLDQTFKELKGRNSKLETYLVVDGYHFSPDYQKAIRENGYGLLIIDDIAHMSCYHSNILLNQNINAESLHYYCDVDTVKLLGCKYVLLRKEFLKYKDWKRNIPSKAKKILLTMGGSDPDNVTLKVVNVLNLLNDQDLEVKIVVGPANPNIKSLQKELFFSCFAFEILYSVSNISELMAWADLAISAGGSTCWEMAYMGLPFLTIILAENQEGIAGNLHEQGISFNLSWFSDLSLKEIAQYLKDIINNPITRKKYSRMGQQLVDGRGSERVVGVLR